MGGRTWSILRCACLAAALTACGGRGEDLSGEGFWVGSADGRQGAIVVTDSGELWGILALSFEASAPDLPSNGRTLHGRLDLRTGTGHLTYLSFDDLGALRMQSPASASLDSQGALSLVLPDATFFGSARESYATPVPIAAFAGHYVGRVFEARAAQVSYPARLTVTAEGLVSHVQDNCTTSGRLTPLEPARQVVAVRLTSTGDCVETDVRTGIAVLDTTARPIRLYVMTTRSDGVGGFGFIGTP
ncbi:MAG TPA: hypothetical protein VLK85_27790 [Ramlibacter sp.]|nr:hypothetical protein [Ramlibacter sp.]